MTGDGARRPRVRLALAGLSLVASGCSAQDSDELDQMAFSFLNFWLMVILAIVAVLVVLAVVGVSFLARGVRRMTRTAPPASAPWWDPTVHTWRAPDGSVFDTNAQRWVPPPPGLAPPTPPTTAPSESDRVSGAVMVGLGGLLVTFAASFMFSGIGRDLFWVAGLVTTALVISVLVNAGRTRPNALPAAASDTTPAPATLAPPPTPPAAAPRRRSRPLRADPEDH